MVSKASDDLPEPDSPVITTSLLRGRVTSIFFRLCSRAPRIAITGPCGPFGIKKARPFGAGVGGFRWFGISGGGGPPQSSMWGNGEGKSSAPRGAAAHGQGIADRSGERGEGKG